jgi:MFS family permease
MRIEEALTNLDEYDRQGIACINIGSLLAQIVQIAGYPTLLALALSRVEYPAWVIGLIVSLQWVAVLILAPLVPSTLIRVGLRASCQAGAAVSIGALSLLLFSTSLPAIAVSSLLMGVGLTIRWVACDTWIVQSFPGRLRGRAVGIHETLMGLGIAVGPFWTMVSDGNETAALLGFILLLALSLISFSFGTQADVSEEEADGDGMSDRKIVPVFRILVLALLAAVVAGYIETAMVALLPIYLMNFQYPEAQALMLLSAFGLGGTILQTPLGWIADRWSYQTGQILCATLIVVGGLLLIGAINNPAVTATALFFWGGSAGGLNTLAVIEAGATLRPNLSGTGMALIASSYTFGGVVGPIVSGSLLSVANGHGAIILILGLMILYTLTLIVHPRQP